MRDLDPAIDEAIYPVISGLARLRPRSAGLTSGLDIDRPVVSRPRKEAAMLAMSFCRFITDGRFRR